MGGLNIKGEGIRVAQVRGSSKIPYPFMGWYMSYSLNSLKGAYTGGYRGFRI